jgi:ribosomal protein S3
MSEKVEVTIHTARPGLVIGKKVLKLTLSRRHYPAKSGKTSGLKLRKLSDLILTQYLLLKGLLVNLSEECPFDGR